jgi:heptosyltransferase-1
MKILVLRVSSIGDVIHTLPAIFLIKKLYPKAKISWVVQKKAADLLINQEFLENVWVLPNKFLEPQNWICTIKQLSKLRKTKWDAIIDFQGIVKTSILAYFLFGTKYGFDKNNSRVGFTSFFTKKHTKPIYTNIIQKNLSLASDVLMNVSPNNFKMFPSLNSISDSFRLKIPKQNIKLLIAG